MIIRNIISPRTCCPSLKAERLLPSTQCRNHLSSGLQRLPRRTHNVIRAHSRPSFGSHYQLRNFSSSPHLEKKVRKADREAKEEADEGKTSGGEDPFDFSSLEQGISTAVEQLRNDLSNLRAGGRFNPEVVENLRLKLDKASSRSVKIGDIAQVIPKGRTVQVLVGELDHVKSVSAAIQGSSLSLTPQPDPTGSNPLLLILNIPPPTAESRRAVVAEAAKAGEKASTSLRDARGKQQKKLRALQLGKSARPDDLKKAGTMMEKVVEKGVAEVKKIVDNAKKVLDST